VDHERFAKLNHEWHCIIIQGSGNAGVGCSAAGEAAEAAVLEVMIDLQPCRA
jgi:hypothetical protein